MAAPSFTPQQLGTAEDWTNPQQSWQRLNAAWGGQLSPEQSAYVNQQIGAGANAANPFSSGGTTAYDSGGTVGEPNPPGTTTAGVKPPSPVATPTPSTTITGVGGTSNIATDANGTTTGVAPQVPLGQTTTADPMQQLVRSRITELLGTNQNQAAITDPDLQPQADAYAAARERERRQQQEAAFARLGAQGVASSGAADTAVKQGYETAGQDIAGYNASLVGQKLQQRVQQLQQAIQVASSMGMSQEANDLSRQLAGLQAQTQMTQLGQNQQMQGIQTKLANLDAQSKTYLANLDADLRREGYSSAERLAIMDNELRRYGIDVQGNLGVLNAVSNLLGMGIQNNQFYDQYGLNIAQLNQGYNNNLIAQMLNG